MDNQNSSFSVSKKSVSGQTVLQIILKGSREDWEPKFQALVDAEFEGDNLKARLIQRIQDIPDNLEKPVTLEIKVGDACIPEDVIISIGQIPQALVETDLPAVYLTSTIEGKHRDVVLLGETHIATKDESQAASRIIPFFDCLGVEGVDVSKCLEGRIFFWVFYSVIAPVLLLLSFGKKRSKKNKSSIEQAVDLVSPTKKLVHLEDGWHPTIRMRIFFVAVPLLITYWLFSVGQSTTEAASDHGIGGAVLYLAVVILAIMLPLPKFLGKISGWFFNLVLDHVFGLTGSRDRNMAKNLVEALHKDGTTGNALVLTGRAHTPKISKILQKKYGFEKRDFPTS